MKEVNITVAEHLTKGRVLVLSTIEETASDTGTKVEEWEVHSGWIDIERAKATLPTVREAILAGRLRIRET